MTPTIASITAKVAAKHPGNYHLSVKESTHCVLGYTIDAFVETENEDLHYATDKAGRLRLVSSKQLTPTYKAIRLEAHDSVVVIRGGAYDGQYVIGYDGDGWLKLSSNMNDCKPMRKSYAVEERNYIAFHAQYCYRGTFEVVTL